MNEYCARCGKPVYFAERKTSLGKQWHPSCLKCIECGKVLSPGQHAEHKSAPYCHNPCYKALFGPSILGYGSNISTPANFARKDRPANHNNNVGESSDFSLKFRNGQTEIFTHQLRNNHHRPVSMPIVPIMTKSPPTAKKKELNPLLKEMIKRVEEFNTYHEGLVRHQMTVDEHDNGTVEVKGPLRIYWGLSRPIQLAPCDDIPPPPISKWRHSLCVQNPPTIPENRLGSSLDWKSTASPSKTRDLDDLCLNSPSSPDDVTMRKKKVRKFKTVAYRGKDEPTRWKRASINGHIFNYDTSVFTPVLGSCTSVTVNADMNTSDVVDVLLDKFKVQNSPEEYDLILVSDNGERLLTSTDKPLMERLRVGPDEALGKLFIKERDTPAASPETPTSTESVFPSEPQLRNTLPRGLPREAFVDTVEEEEEENLPMEVETLLILPEAVLRGVLAKYSKDEEQEVSLVKARYATAKNRIRQRMSAMTPLNSSSKA